MEKLKLYEIFEKSLEEGASDIHLIPGEKVFFRIEGHLILKEYFEEVTEEKIQDLIFPFLFFEELEKLKKYKELDFSIGIENIGRFRGNIFKAFGKINLVLRVLKNKIYSLEELGFKEHLNKLVEYKNGLILITGKTGQGKSTTLASLIEKINLEKSYHIITLEEPIEYVFKNKKSIIHQREIGKDIKSFKNSLRGILRQDPDIIVISELRDRETIELALEASETGHLVISTLHTNGAVETIERIVSQFSMENEDMIYTSLSESLRAIVSQEFKIDKNGKRKLAYEILIVNNGVKNMIKCKNISQIKSLIEMGGRDGMVTREKSLGL
ncbi:twitching motility protein PilT [Cetobacterium ceti]|uniref:Twitching motility protein PilT n=1 Tax=Cetobacterium ceti TaxID=180163 RepID=A0A1T4Q0V3_9FUSO|nr:PilT/PilU family type 4a pilus ATPase [Cetobacterium ceti]SJZ97354.1 twitching motility protein PilT [Cetobacterium ceti]